MKVREVWQNTVRMFAFKINNSVLVIMNPEMFNMPSSS